MIPFVQTEIARAQQKGYDYPVPEKLSIAYFLDKMKWDIFTFRATPPHVIDEIRFLWQLQNEVEAAESRKRNASKS